MTPQQSEQIVKGIADRMHEHARKCKKAPEECKTCVINMKWFGELPPQTLSKVLSE